MTENTTGENPFVTISELAEEMGKSVRALERAIRRNELPKPAKLFNVRTFTRQSLVDHHEARMQILRTEKTVTRQKLGLTA